MDFLDISYETDKVRVSLKSNSSSSTVYIEEFPSSYLQKEKVHVLSIYFYFRGDRNFDILGMLNSIKNMQDYNFIQIRDFILEKCSSIRPDEEWSYSSKIIDGFTVKPPKGYCLPVHGTDFCGFCFWGSFFFISKDRKICLSMDKESSRKLFYTMHKKRGYLNDKPYLFLINMLNRGNIHYSGDK